MNSVARAIHIWGAHAAGVWFSAARRKSCLFCLRRTVRRAAEQQHAGRMRSPDQSRSSTGNSCES